MRHVTSSDRKLMKTYNYILSFNKEKKSILQVCDKPLLNDDFLATWVKDQSEHTRESGLSYYNKWKYSQIERAKKCYITIVIGYIRNTCL